MPSFSKHVSLLTVVILCIAAAGSCGQITPSEYWKNRMAIPADPFERRDITQTALGWVKFTILTDPYDPNIVYFQDSKKYLLHYDFAVERVEGYCCRTAHLVTGECFGFDWRRSWNHDEGFQSRDRFDAGL